MFDDDYDEEEDVFTELHSEELEELNIILNVVPYEWSEKFCTCKQPAYDDFLTLAESQAIQDIVNKRMAAAAEAKPDAYRYSPEELLNYRIKAPFHDFSHCSKCKKRPRHHLLNCSVCGQRFDRMYTHHAVTGSVWDRNATRGWAWAKSICWTCLIKQDPAVDGDRPPEFITPPRGPAVLNLDFDDLDVSF